MIKHLLNILNLNDRYAYAAISFFRKRLLFISNFTISLQVFLLERNLRGRQKSFRHQIKNILPKVTRELITANLRKNEIFELIKLADKYVNKEFCILSKDIKFKEKINWNLDFNSNYEWKKGKLYNKYEQVNIYNNADVKFPRELSRCHHFLIMGQAYIITKEEKYVNEFKTQVLHWIKENPYKKSINWGCSMDIAIRAANWIYSLRMFMDSPLIDEIFLEKIALSLYLHGRYIFEHPEKNKINNHNHFLSDLAGQIILGFLFDKAEAKLWKENGIYEFYKEIRFQILPTGPSYERSTNYHRLVTELVAYTVIFLINNGQIIPQDILFRVKKMFYFIMAYNDVYQKAPIIGDQDNGRFLPFRIHEINNHKYLYSTGAILFKDLKLKYFSSGNDISNLFLFGENGKSIYEAINNRKQLVLRSESFSDAGFYLLKSKKNYLFVNNSGLSHYNEIKSSTHTHSDLLSFVYYFKGFPILVDPGTYVYSSNPEERMKFRSTYMHNTITINSLDQNRIKREDLWYIRRDAIPKEIYWYDDDEKTIYKGAHSGYLKLQNPLLHTREFILNKNDETVLIIDMLESSRLYQVDIHYHFDSHVKVELIDKVVQCNINGDIVFILFDAPYEYKLTLKQEYVSDAYNKKVLAPYLIVSFNGKNNIEFITKINYKNNETNI